MIKAPVSEMRGKVSIYNAPLVDRQIPQSSIKTVFLSIPLGGREPGPRSSLGAPEGTQEQRYNPETETPADTERLVKLTQMSGYT